jgi:hypothetical protein
MSEIDIWNREHRMAEWDELQVRFAALQQFLQDAPNNPMNISLDEAISQLLTLAPSLSVSLVSASVIP